MKPFKLFLIVFALLTMNFGNAPEPLSKAERKFAVKLLRQTKEDLLKQTKGLSPVQLNFKPDAETWSIAECVEHIAISENNFNTFVQAALKEPADPQKRKEVKMTDEAVVKMITDRSYKVKTSEPFVPSGKFGSFEATLTEFATKRDNNIRYIQGTGDDLRNHFNDFPFGKIDTYQTILFMAGHSRRHIEQIKELMTHRNFPGKAQKRR
jgi:hypothetical protein